MHPEVVEQCPVFACAIAASECVPGTWGPSGKGILIGSIGADSMGNDASVRANTLVSSRNWEQGSTLG